MYMQAAMKLLLRLLNLTTLFHSEFAICGILKSHVERMTEHFAT